MTTRSEPTDQIPVLTLVNNDPPGARCNRNIQAAAEVANRYRITVQLLPRSLAGPGALAPAVYLNGDPLTVDGDPAKGVIDAQRLDEILDNAGIPRHAKPGRLSEISSELAQLREAIGPVPG